MIGGYEVRTISKSSVRGTATLLKPSRKLGLIRRAPGEATTNGWGNHTLTKFPKNNA